jgi:predicted outer membrane repeat protein
MNQLLRHFRATFRTAAARRRSGSLCWKGHALEARVLLAHAPVAVDDFVSGIPTIDSRTSASESHFIDILANDFDADSDLDPLNLQNIEIVDHPRHGELTVQLDDLFYRHTQEWNTAQHPPVDFDSSPVGNGTASALHGVVDASGQLGLIVAPQLPDDPLPGEFILYVRLGSNEFGGRNQYHHRFAGTLSAAAERPFVIPNLSPGTKFYAWIDNAVGAHAPDTVLKRFDPSAGQVYYKPDMDFVGSDAFTYRIRDRQGNLSNVAQVILHVDPQPSSHVWRKSSFETESNKPATMDLGYFRFDPTRTKEVRITRLPDHGQVSSLSSITRGPANDNGSPMGNGFASRVTGIVNIPDEYQQGRVSLTVTGAGDAAFVGNHTQSGEFELYLDIEGEPAQVVRGVIQPGQTKTFDFRGTLGDSFVAWIDNVIPDSPEAPPDTLMAQVLSRPSFVTYRPDANYQGVDSFSFQLIDVDGHAADEIVMTAYVGLGSVQAFAETKAGWDVGMDLLRPFDGEFPRPTVVPSTLTVTIPPQHGAVSLDHGQILGGMNDDGGPFAGSAASMLQGVVDAAGHLSLIVSGVGDSNLLGAHGQQGQFQLFVSLDSDLPEDPDYQFNGILSSGQFTRFDLPNLTPGLSFVAWIDNTVGESQPDTVLGKMIAGPGIVRYVPDPGFVGEDRFYYSVQDDQGVTITGLASVNVFLKPPTVKSDTASTPSGSPVTIDLLANDQDPDGSLSNCLVQIVDAPSRGTVTQTGTGPLVVYTPAAARSEFVVDSLGDVDDGNYSKGHLSLREALKLATSYTDEFTYRLTDQDGLTSPLATARVKVEAPPATIRFDPKLTARRSVELSISKVGDTAEGNSAFRIGSHVTLIGPSGKRGISLRGPGSVADLRAFTVTGGGTLNLQNLRFTNWFSDGDGAVITVVAGGNASLTNCEFSRNNAFSRGGAISSFGDLTITRSRFIANRASDGGAVWTIGTAAISHSTFSSNTADSGGGLFNRGTLSVADSQFTWNSVIQVGGGLASSEGTATLTRVSFSQNRAARGGGLANLAGALTLLHCTVTQNRAAQGAGIENGTLVVPVQLGITETWGTVSATGCLISGNIATADGGGIHNLGDFTLLRSKLLNNRAVRGAGLFTSAVGYSRDTANTVTLTGCTVQGNRAKSGAGFYNDLTFATLQNSTFASNIATEFGGGILNDASLTMSNVTLALNSAVRGAGLYNGFGQATIESSTLSQNTASLGGGIYNHAGHLVLTNSIVAGNRKGRIVSDVAGPTVIAAASHHNLIGGDPLLAPLGDYGGPVQTMALLPGSSAINAGTQTGPDARGVGPVGVRDLGAFESRGFTLAIVSGSGQSVKPGKTFAKPLLVQVRANVAIEPVAGGVVTFVGPSTGASLQPPTATAVIGRNGKAQRKVTANRLAGGFRVTARIGGTSVPFELRTLGTTTPAVSADRIAAKPGSPASPAQTVAAATPIPSGGYEVLPASRTEYRLTTLHNLQQRVPRGRWTTIASKVGKYVQTPNGDLFVLTTDGTLRQYKLGAWSTLQTGVTGLAMDSFGTVQMIDSIGSTSRYWALDRYYVLPESPNGSFPFALDPPSDLEVMQAAAMASAFNLDFTNTFENDVQYFPAGPAFPLSNELQHLLDEIEEARGVIIADPQNVRHRSNDVPSKINNVRILKEMIVDTVEPPRDFAGIGPAQLHRVRYKATIYFDTVSLVPGPPVNGEPGRVQEDEQVVVFIDHDHLHRYEPGHLPVLTAPHGQSSDGVSAASSPASNRLMAGGTLAAAAAPAPVHAPGLSIQRREDQFVQALATAKDGTQYKWGDAFDGYPRVGTETGLSLLFRLVPNAVWEPIEYASAFAVAPDSSICFLNKDHQLKRLPSDALLADAAVLAEGIEAFSMQRDGTLYALNGRHELLQRRPGQSGWSTIRTGVQALSMDLNDRILILHTSGQFQRLIGNGRWATLDWGVQSFSMTTDGAVYALKGRGELKRWTGFSGVRRLAIGVKAFQVALDGRVFALTRGGALQQLTARDHWTVLEQNVSEFVVATNGDLYLITNRQELHRQKLGYSWASLQTGVTSMQTFVGGEVYAFNSAGQRTVYASLGLYYTLESGRFFVGVPPTEYQLAVEAANLQVTPNLDNANPFDDIQYVLAGPEFPTAEGAEDGESEDPEAAFNFGGVTGRPALRFSSSPYEVPEQVKVNNLRIVVDKMTDEHDAPRMIANVGVVKVHHAQYKATLYYDLLLSGQSVRPQVEEVYYDLDHLHQATHDEVGGG